MNQLLSSQQIEALRNVDVHFGWISHGYTPSLFQHGFPIENGPAVFGVTDGDYATPAAHLSEMQQGDVVACERTFGTMYDAEPTRTAPLPLATLVADINGILRSSPYVERSPLDAVLDHNATAIQRQLAEDSPTAIHDQPALAQALADSVALGRELMLISPFEYTAGLAAVQGVRRAIADSTFRSLRSGEAQDIAVRNADMASCLGDIALDMMSSPSVPGRRPRLAFIAGAGHKDVEAIFASHKIPFQSKASKRAMGWRFFLASWLDVKNYDYHQNVHATRRWFDNLRAHGHEPVAE